MIIKILDNGSTTVLRGKPYEKELLEIIFQVRMKTDNVDELLETVKKFLESKNLAYEYYKEKALTRIIHTFIATPFNVENSV